MAARPNVTSLVGCISMSESPITVRRARGDDWMALRTIRLESLADTPEAFGSTFTESSTWPDDRWREMAEKWVYFFAERDGRPVGMVSGGFNDGRPGTRWMYGMFVTPSERGGSAAAMLVEAVSGWARDEGVHDIFLHVATSVARARAFYSKMGFELTGDTITMDRDPTITLVTMVRSLD